MSKKDKKKKEEKLEEGAGVETESQEAKREDDDEVVVRKEFREILTQIFQNIGELSTHLMNDVNALFQKFAYPNHIRVAAIIEILEEKGIANKKEIADKATEIMKKAVEEAKEVDDKGNFIRGSKKDKKH